jgi:serine/threonine kinase PknH
VQGTPFGRYRLIELLGRGGMGEVWRAHDTAANNRTVAIKLLPPHLAQDHTFVQRFRREAHAAARLNSPHVIPIHNYGEIDGRLYVDMRLIEGRDLQTVLADGPLPPGRAVRIIEQVAKALQAAHRVGLVHRDVKPSNILLDEDDFAYLIDFGLARGVDQSRLTGTGSIIGSWPYMSPERLRAGQVDARSDIYALACVLYECLTGSTPYPGDNFEQQITAHLTAPPPRPSSTDPNVPATFDPVIATGMAKDPDQRYATTVELANAAHDAITTPIPRPAQNLRTSPAFVTNPAPPMPATEPAAQQQSADLNVAATQQGPPDRPPPDSRTPTPQPWWQRQRREVKLGMIAAIVVILAAGTGITGYLLRQPPSQTPTAQPAPPSRLTTTSQPTSAAQPIKVGLYQQFQSASAVGPNGQSINATLAGESYPTSTGMWVGCEGSPATTTYRLDHKFAELNAVVGMQPHTPDGLTAHVTISGDGQVLKEFTVGKTANIPIDLTLNGMDSLVVAAILQTGICTPASIPYGALGDAVLTQVGG